MYLITKIALCLVLAFGFGFAIAWFAWRAHAERRETELTSRFEQRLGDTQRQSDTRQAKLRHEVEESRQQIPTLEASLAERSVLIATLESDLLEWRERFPQVEAQLAQREEHIAQLERKQTAAAADIDGLKAQLAQAASQAAQATPNELPADADKAVRRAREDQRRAEARVQALGTELDTLHVTLDEVSAKCETALNELESLRKGRTSEQDQQALSVMTQRAQEQSETIAEHSNAVRLFEQERTVLRNANAQLKQTVDAQTQKLAELIEQGQAGKSAPRPPGVRPMGLLGGLPAGRVPDDLKKIRGVGPVLERTLNKLGIYFFAQIATLKQPEIEWVANHINTFPGRIARDQWVEQARDLDR